MSEPPFNISMSMSKIGKQITIEITKTLYSHLNLEPSLFVLSSFYLPTFVLVLLDIYTNLGGKILN
jgi:hypothetical protein